jgi:hypothetical protein
VHKRQINRHGIIYGLIAKLIFPTSFLKALLGKPLEVCVTFTAVIEVMSEV